MTGRSISFIRDVALIHVENLHRLPDYPRKSRKRVCDDELYSARQGGQQEKASRSSTDEPDESNLVEVIGGPEGKPPDAVQARPALATEKIATIVRWVKEGAEVRWNLAGRRAGPSSCSDSESHHSRPRYPATVPITAARFSPQRLDNRGVRGIHEDHPFWKTADGTLESRLTGPRRSDLRHSPTAPTAKWMATAPAATPERLRRRQGFGGPSPADASRCATWWKPRMWCSPSLSAPTTKRSPPPALAGAIRIFRVESGKLLSQIEDHADWIFAVAWSPDGKRLASASRDKTAKVFDIEKKESLVTFPTHAQPVYTISFTPDGKGIVTGSEDNRIRVWNPDNDGKGDPRHERFRRDCLQAAVLTGRQESARVLRRQDRHRLGRDSARKSASFKAHNDWIYSLAISRDSKDIIASGSWDGEDQAAGTWPTASMIRTIIAALVTSRRLCRRRASNCDQPKSSAMASPAGPTSCRSSTVWPWKRPSIGIEFSIKVVNGRQYILGRDRPERRGRQPVGRSLPGPGRPECLRRPSRCSRRHGQ